MLPLRARAPSSPIWSCARDEKAAALLRKRTLTYLYNERLAWLDPAHCNLDAAVAYGWPADLSEERILERPFALNQRAPLSDVIPAPRVPDRGRERDTRPGPMHIKTSSCVQGHGRLAPRPRRAPYGADALYQSRICSPVHDTTPSCARISAKARSTWPMRCGTPER